MIVGFITSAELGWEILWPCGFVVTCCKMFRFEYLLPGNIWLSERRKDRGTIIGGPNALPLVRVTRY